jgi:hypothetical protein
MGERDFGQPAGADVIEGCTRFTATVRPQPERLRLPFTS